MRKTVGVLIIIVLVVGLFSLSLQAQVKKFRVRVVTEQANIRVKPDISSEMLFQIPEGTELEAEKKEGEWFLVVFDRADGTKGRGYVHESLVEVILPDKPTVVTPIKPEKPVPAKEQEPVRVEKKPESRAKVKIPEQARIARAVSDRLSISVHSGGVYISASELNEATEGVTNYYFYAFGYNGRANLRPLHLAFTYGMDFFYQVSSGFYLGLGFDYYQRSKANHTDFAVNDNNYSVRTTIGIKDLPLRISLMYQPAKLFYLRLGIEYHLAKARYSYLVTQYVNSPEESWTSWSGKASGHSLGWVEAAGLRWSATSWCQLFLESSYRYARIKNFHGTNVYTDSDGLEQTEKGDLYYWQVQVSSNVSYPVLFVRDRIPSELGVINPRKADISFSGFSLQLGLHFKF